MLNPKYIGKYMNLELLIFLKNYIGKLSPKSGKEVNSKFSKLRFWLFWLFKDHEIHFSSSVAQNVYQWSTITERRKGFTQQLVEKIKFSIRLPQNWFFRRITFPLSRDEMKSKIFSVKIVHITNWYYFRKKKFCIIY